MKRVLESYYRIVVMLVVCFSVIVTTLAQYTERDIYAYIEQYKDVAMQKMTEYGIPASITIAQGVYESACGKSRLAVEGNNHFGIKCHDWEGDTILVDDDALQECFRKYITVADSYNDHSLFLKNRKRYANLFTLNVMDYAAWARTLKADGYATNPKYADQLISLIQRFNLARLDTLCMYGGVDKKQIVHKFDTLGDLPKEYKPRKTTSNVKVFTVIGNDYPTGNSPFSYRKVFENNHTYFVIAQKSDSYERIAGDVQVAAANLRKFNDALDGAQPVENEIVYIEAKSKSNPVRVHVVQSGETLRYIAQRYGVQLHYIFKYNMLDEKSIIHPGDQIMLKH